MKAKSIRGATFSEIKSAFNDSLEDGYNPTLAIIFSSASDDRERICNLLSDHGVSIFGVSSYGEFIDENYEGLSISILLLDINHEYFRVELRQYNEGPVSEVTTEIGKIGKSVFKNPAFIVSGSNTSADVGQIIEGIESETGKDVTIIGGYAAAEKLDKGNHVFDNEKVSYSGVIALILNMDKLHVVGDAISGWKSIGTPKTITKSEGNWVYTLDDQPALDVFLKFMGAELNTKDEEDLFKKVGNVYPLSITDNEGDSFMRAPLLFNIEERSFMCAGKVPEGATVRFSMPPDFTVGEDVIQNAHNVRDDILPDADAVIVFSCLGRLTCLGPMIANEIEGLLKTWNVPMIGFFTFGEFGRIKNGKNMFLNTTVSWVALKEK